MAGFRLRRVNFQATTGVVLLGVAIAGCGLIAYILLIELQLSGLQIPETGLVLEGVRIGRPSSGLLKIENNGFWPVKISRIATSCGCTGVHISRTMLGPGDIANLTVTYTASAGSAVGRVAEIMLWTEGNARPQWIIPVNISSLDDVVVTPELLDFGYLRKQDLPASRSVYAIYRSRLPMESVAFHWSCPANWVKIKEKFRNSERGEIVFDVVLQDDAPTGRMKERLMLFVRDRNGKLLFEHFLHMQADCEK